MAVQAQYQRSSQKVRDLELGMNVSVHLDSIMRSLHVANFVSGEICQFYLDN